MTKGYTLAVIRTDENGYGVGMKLFEYTNRLDAETEMNGIFADMRTILTEWAQFENGLGNYEIEIARRW